jgi:hypothetical protein
VGSTTVGCHPTDVTPLVASLGAGLRPADYRPAWPVLVACGLLAACFATAIAGADDAG